MQPEVRDIQGNLALRPAHPGDANHLERWRRESEVRRHQPLAASTVAQLYSELTQQKIGDLYRGRGDKYQWIVLRSGRPAGWITLVITNWNHGLGEIGYALSSRFQRGGLMPRALDLLLGDLLLNSPLRRIEARCAIENVASQKVLENVGFRREGLLRDYFLLRGRPVDNYLYAILKRDWQGS